MLMGAANAPGIRATDVVEACTTSKPAEKHTTTTQHYSKQDVLNLHWLAPA